jgi:hypothetical protein
MLLIILLVYGQAEDGIVLYNKTHQPAAMISLPYTTNVVNAAMDDYLSKKGSKGDDLKGFKTFRNTRLVQSDSVNADLYFKVTRKSRSEKDKSVIYLLVGMPNEDMANRTQETHFTKEQSKHYLNNLSYVIEAYNLELQIKQQNENVIKEEKRYKNLINDGNDLTKRKGDIEQKIVNNKGEQNKQNTEVEKQKQALAMLVSQRKN